MYLNCKTYFSFRYGTMSQKELISAAGERGVSSLALTNINSTCDLWDFVKDCHEAGIKPIAGAEIRNEDDLLYILLAANNAGLAWINQFLSGHFETKKPFPQKAHKEFFDNTKDGFVIYPFDKRTPEELLPNERIGILPEEVNKLYGLEIKKYASCFVIRQPVTFLDKQHYNVHKLLRAIDKNTLLSKLPASAVCSENESFVTSHKLLEAFKQYPGIVTNTYKLMDACSIEMEFHKDKNKKVFSASKEDDKISISKARTGWTCISLSQ